MDHSHHMMGHGDMDMPGHGGHDMPSTEMCAMSMLFTWNTKNLCIVFESWHIQTTAGLIFSLLAVILIGMGYEALRAGTRRYEIVMRKRVDSTPSESPPPASVATTKRQKQDSPSPMVASGQWSVTRVPLSLPSNGTRAWVLSTSIFFLASEYLSAICSRATEKCLHTTRGDIVTETTPLAWAIGQNKSQVNKRVKLIKAVMYATQTFYAFMLMLVFMTYNGWVMVAVTLGAFLGYFVFGDETSATKETQCH